MNLVRPNTDDFSVFVGDLAPDVTDFVLQEAFRVYYPSVRSAKVIVDPATGRSKGYGFVRFANEAERDKSLEMQGYQLSNRPIRVSLATARRSPSTGMPGTHPAELDPTNTTLFIGGLSAGVSEDELRAIFVRYGEVVYTKIPQGKGCGFVQFVNRPDAEAAMAEMNGQMVGASAIRISWGRSTSRTAILQAQQRPAPGALAAYGAFAAPAGYGAAPGALVDPYGAVAAAPAGLAPAGAMYAAAAPAAAGMYGIAAGGGVYGGVPALSAGFTVGSADAAQYVLATTQGFAGLQVQQPLAGQLLGALQQPQQMYDPMTIDVSKLNSIFVQRQQPGLTGAFIRQM
uniref:RRM domain-containing protein n=1 Tax=Tetradesmus obliquus TaxID=3088 RepID=A0A383W2Q4_TETOB|eukprot:jgi/Sobl393_1/17572/SZX71392.1